MTNESFHASDGAVGADLASPLPHPALALPLPKDKYRSGRQGDAAFFHEKLILQAEKKGRGGRPSQSLSRGCCGGSKQRKGLQGLCFST